MKKLLIILIFTLILACTPKTIITGPTQIDGTMTNIGTFYYQQHQMDSMCIADTLPGLNAWQYIGQVDYETGNQIHIYFFIKQDTINNKELMYRALLKDSIYKVTKRLTE